MYSAKLNSNIQDEYGVWLWNEFKDVPEPRLVTLTTAVNDDYKPSDEYVAKRVKTIVLGLGDYNKKSIFFLEYTKIGWPHVHGIVQGDSTDQWEVRHSRNGQPYLEAFGESKDLLDENWYKTTADPAFYEYDSNVNGFPRLVREVEGRAPLGFVKYEKIRSLLKYCLYISKEGRFLYGRMHNGLAMGSSDSSTRI